MFCPGHPKLCLLTPVPTDCGIMGQYVHLLEETVTAYDIRVEPHLLFKVNETTLHLGAKPLEAIAGSIECDPTSISRTKITVVGCVGGSGTCLPPMVIWGCKTMSSNFAEGGVRDAMYGFSSCCRMDSQLFYGWFCDHFLRYAPKNRPIVLLLDSHLACFCLENTIREAIANDVIVFCLPPNSRDRGYFTVLKTKWLEVRENYTTENPDKAVTWCSFLRLFAEAWQNFQSTVVVPLLKVDSTIERPISRSNLKFLPMSSPIPTHPKLQAANPATFTTEGHSEARKKSEARGQGTCSDGKRHCGTHCQIPGVHL